MPVSRVPVQSPGEAQTFQGPPAPATMGDYLREAFLFRWNLLFFIGGAAAAAVLLARL